MTESYTSILIVTSAEDRRANRDAAAAKWRERLRWFAERGLKPRLLDQDDLAMLARGEMPAFEPIELAGNPAGVLAPFTGTAVADSPALRAMHAYAAEPVLLPEESAGVPMRMVPAVIDSPSTIRTGQPETPTQAKQAGYSGDACSCGSLQMRRNGTCLLCEVCGQSTGCS